MDVSDTKKNCVSSIVLGIVGIVFSFFVPAVSYSCSTTGLIIGIKKRKTHKSNAGIILNIIALALAAINSICGILMTIKMFNGDKKDSTFAADTDEIKDNK